MDAPDVLRQIKETNKTELSRLGSSKSLYADTEGEMEPDAVLTATADAAYHAAETLDGWSRNGEFDNVFAEAAERERDHYDEIVAELDAHEPGERPAVVDAMRSVDDSEGRLGALVGWTLVAKEKASQSTGFFTGQAKPRTASTFRAFDDDYESSREDALDALGAVADTDEDFERAQSVASIVIQAAYDEYFETLEELGVNPKPVC